MAWRGEGKGEGDGGGGEQDSGETTVIAGMSRNGSQQMWQEKRAGAGRGAVGERVPPRAFQMTATYFLIGLLLRSRSISSTMNWRHMAK